MSATDGLSLLAALLLVALAALWWWGFRSKP